MVDLEFIDDLKDIGLLIIWEALGLVITSNSL